MIILYGDLHTTWKARNLKICEHSIFLIVEQQLYLNIFMFNETFKIRWFI